MICSHSNDIVEPENWIGLLFYQMQFHIVLQKLHPWSQVYFTCSPKKMGMRASYWYIWLKVPGYLGQLSGRGFLVACALYGDNHYRLCWLCRWWPLMSNIFTAAQCKCCYFSPSGTLLSLTVTVGAFSEVLHAEWGWFDSNDFQFRFPLIMFNTAEWHCALVHQSIGGYNTALQSPDMFSVLFLNDCQELMFDTISC